MKILILIRFTLLVVRDYLQEVIRLRKIFIAIGLGILLLFSLVGCSEPTAETAPFIVVKSDLEMYIQDIRILTENVRKIKEGSKNHFIVTHSGKNVTKKYKDEIPETDEEIMDFIMLKSQLGYVRFVEKGQYRVTTWKKEIDGLFKNKRSLTQMYTPTLENLGSSRLNEFELRDKFMQETQKMYNKKDYEGIIYHIMMNNYTIYSLKDDIKTLDNFKK